MKRFAAPLRVVQSARLHAIFKNRVSIYAIQAQKETNLVSNIKWARKLMLFTCCDYNNLES